ncbi:hypothetical protein A5694_22125 [Mycolicibacter sinensis]|nr:hypothetical protein A5694_22125 [Mycolicibacter sinensis]
MSTRAPSTRPDIGHNQNVSAYPTVIGIADNTKIQRQPRKSTHIPPNKGPSAKAVPVHPVQTPIAADRAALSNTVLISASEPGTRKAAPRPWMMRAVTSAAGDVAAAARTEPTPKASRPHRITGMRPSRSEIDPPGRITVAIANK